MRIEEQIGRIIEIEATTNIIKEKESPETQLK